mmetsp:Transcript_16930/g.34203  ORF Transcript_16930/g.34203 Transcript_16930/m.34203 type:complete len:120 (-) Transcript_16930:5-364(-)
MRRPARSMLAGWLDGLVVSAGAAGTGAAGPGLMIMHGVWRWAGGKANNGRLFSRCHFDGMVTSESLDPCRHEHRLNSSAQAKLAKAATAKTKHTTIHPSDDDRMLSTRRDLTNPTHALD